MQVFFVSLFYDTSSLRVYFMAQNVGQYDVKTIVKPVKANRWEFCQSMRDRTNTCVPRIGSTRRFLDKRGKFCKHLKGFKTKINRMNEENFAAFFVLLAFIELSSTVTSLTGETNSNKRETRALA